MMDLSKYLVKKGSVEYSNFEGSEAEESIYTYLFEHNEFDKEINKNQFKTLSYEITAETTDDEDGTVTQYEASFNLYYNVPEPGKLISAGNGYYISPIAYVFKRIIQSKSVNPGYHSYDSWKLGNASDYLNETEYLEYYIADMRDLKVPEWTSEIIVHNNNKIETNKVYEVKTPEKKYLLVEAKDGIYKTTDLKNPKKYKKVNEEKAKKFINNPQNIWKGIKVTDLMVAPMVIEEFENPDEKLKMAINEFKKKTGIQLEKIYTNNDKVYLQGENKNYSVEVQLKHKNGKYEIHEYGTEVIDKDNSPKNSGMMVKKLTTLANNIFKKC